ncbi:hypothetical protein [Microbacterium sp. NC79]|nr:hypothetical protein [Microbacterium sp. NC79]
MSAAIVMLGCAASLLMSRLLDPVDVESVAATANLAEAIEPAN